MGGGLSPLLGLSATIAAGLAKVITAVLLYSTGICFFLLSCRVAKQKSLFYSGVCTYLLHKS